MVTPAAYLVVTARVSDRVKMQAYGKAITDAALYPRHGGRYLFIGRAAIALEDWPEGDSVVVAEFPSRTHAEAFWWSETYQREIKPLREGAGEFHVAIFDGVPA